MCSAASSGSNGVGETALIVRTTQVGLVKISRSATAAMIRASSAGPARSGSARQPSGPYGSANRTRQLYQRRITRHERSQVDRGSTGRESRVRGTGLAPDPAKGTGGVRSGGTAAARRPIRDAPCEGRQVQREGLQSRQRSSPTPPGPVSARRVGHRLRWEPRSRAGYSVSDSPILGALRCVEWIAANLASVNSCSANPSAILKFSSSVVCRCGLLISLVRAGEPRAQADVNRGEAYSSIVPFM